MNKQIIVISETKCAISKAVTLSASEFLSSDSHKNAYVLVDRRFVTTKEISAIKNHCQEIGLNPFIDGSYMDASYIFLIDWQEEDELQAFDKAVLESIQYMEESEAQRKLYQLEDAKNLNKTVHKLIALAKDSAASFGEKRNAINAAYRMIFSV